MPYESVDMIRVWTMGRNLLQDFRGQEGGQPFLLPAEPEAQNGLNKIDNAVVALNMALFSQEMNKDILAVRYLIKLC